MKIINNKGFTLIEVLAVIAIIAILGLVTVPGVMSTINNSKNSSYNIMVEDIKTASISLYEEVEYVGGTVYQYDGNGNKKSQITINNNSIETNLQTLVSNGYLKGTTENKKPILKNPKTDKNIGYCSIVITKNVLDKVNYSITSDSSDENCPKTNEYK